MTTTRSSSAASSTSASPDDWAFAIWQASTDSYADAVLLDGSLTGHPSQALDTACTLYLADTGDHPQ